MVTDHSSTRRVESFTPKHFRPHKLAEIAVRNLTFYFSYHPIIFSDSDVGELWVFFPSQSHTCLKNFPTKIFIASSNHQFSGNSKSISSPKYFIPSINQHPSRNPPTKRQTFLQVVGKNMQYSVIFPKMLVKSWWWIYHGRILFFQSPQGSKCSIFSIFGMLPGTHDSSGKSRFTLQ